MWEEHPEYQKQQMRFIGIFLVVVFVVFVVYAIIEQQWDFLKIVLSLGGALVISLGTLSGAAWLIVRLVTRRRANAKKENGKPDA
jgi:uncharacterized membrane protein